MKISIERKLALGQVLARHRTLAGLTQDELAERSGVPIRTLQRAECGDGLGQGSLQTLAATLQTTASDLLTAAASHEGDSPQRRVDLRQVVTTADLIDCLRKTRGTLQLAPEGEHGFNEHIAGFILELGSQLRGRRTLSRADQNLAHYVLGCCTEMGFLLFAGRYKEEIEHSQRLLRQPTTVILATPSSDERVRKTSKGATLDYLADKRKEVLHRVLKTGLTVYDWLEDLYISKSDGEERVRTCLDNFRRTHSRFMRMSAAKDVL